MAEGELLKQAHTMPGPRQPPGCRAAHRSAAHHDHIHCPFRRHDCSCLYVSRGEMMEQRARLRHTVHRSAKGVIPKNEESRRLSALTSKVCPLRLWPRGKVAIIP